MTKLLWSAKNLELRARDTKIYHIDSIEIHAGEHVALLGDSRHFRRSFFRELAGLESPLKGELCVEGERLPLRDERHPWRDLLSKKMRRKIGVSLENEGLLSNVSVRESLETLFRFKYGDHNASLIEGSQRVVEESATRVGLGEDSLDKRPSELGRLELRLASLCLAFLTKPVILLMENPSQGLHDKGWQALSDTLGDILGSAQRTLVMDTDDWLLAKRHAERWIVFEEGVVIFDGKADDFIARSGPRLLAELETERWQTRHHWIDELRKNLGAA
ncbi:MAG: ATP-binding cassette domain-containing protein [Bdellovibrionota bacterium]